MYSVHFATQDNFSICGERTSLKCTYGLQLHGCIVCNIKYVVLAFLQLVDIFRRIICLFTCCPAAKRSDLNNKNETSVLVYILCKVLMYNIGSNCMW